MLYFGQYCVSAPVNKAEIGRRTVLRFKPRTQKSFDGRCEQSALLWSVAVTRERSVRLGIAPLNHHAIAAAGNMSWKTLHPHVPHGGLTPSVSATKPRCTGSHFKTRAPACSPPRRFLHDAMTTDWSLSCVSPLEVIYGDVSYSPPSEQASIIGNFCVT